MANGTSSRLVESTSKAEKGVMPLSRVSVDAILDVASRQRLGEHFLLLVDKTFEGLTWVTT